MPLHSKEQINNGIVALWKITESFDDLVDLIPVAWLENIDLSRVSRHNLAARALANTVCPDFDILEKDEYGKPYFDSVENKISLTHSGDFAGFMLKKGEECGLDMERISKRIQRISSRFIRLDERDFESYGLKGLYMVWCAKEAMYKYYGMKALDFKEHLKVNLSDLSSSEGKLTGIISKDQYYKELTLDYKQVDDYLMVYTN